MNPKGKALKKKLTPKPSIHDVKHHTESTGDNPHFFTRKSMKFFGQSMKDFHVGRTKGSYFKISAPSRHGSTTERYYDPKKGALHSAHKHDARTKSVMRHYRRHEK